MGLISKEVEINICGGNYKHYEELGYYIPRSKNKWGRMGILQGTKIIVKVEDLQKNSSVIVKCVCDGCGCALDWTYQNYNKCLRDDNKIYCNECSKSKIYDLNNTKTFENWCIESHNEHLLTLWDYKLNTYLPNEVTFKSEKIVWLKCNKHTNHKSEADRVCNIVNRNGTVKCKQCNSIAQWFIDNNLDINDYWDYDKNKDIDIWNIAHANNDKKVWMKCQNKDYHNSYNIRLNNFIKGKRCPYCSGKKIHPKDSIGQYIRDSYGKEFLEKIWSDKNKKSSFEYAPQCNKKAWFKCPIGKHEDHEMKIQNATLRDYRCPQCTKERTESLIEEKTRLYLESLGYTILHEYNCTIKPRNPKTNTIMPFDNEIKELKLIIEVHGKQHYMSDFYDYRYSKEEGKHLLHQRQLYDRYKKIYAIQNDYEYLELNWKMFNKTDTYKQMIDNKIKEILNKNY